MPSNTDQRQAALEAARRILAKGYPLGMDTEEHLVARELLAAHAEGERLKVELDQRNQPRVEWSEGATVNLPFPFTPGDQSP